MRLKDTIVASRLTFSKFPKATVRSLARQRARIWDPGLFGAFTRCSPIRLRKGADALFLQWYWLFEGLLHPVKLASFALILVGISSIENTESYLAIAASVILTIYVAALALSLFLWVWHWKDTERPGRILFILVFLYIYPTAHLWVLDTPGGFLFYLLSWSLMSSVLSFLIDNRETRSRIKWFVALIPYYFLFLSIGTRTVGLAVWLAKRSTDEVR